MTKRCPLCQKELQNGECVSCGYRLPEEEEYIREITPEVQAEEIYPDRSEPIDIKVRDSQGNTIGQDGRDDRVDTYRQSENFPYGQQRPAINDLDDLMRSPWWWLILPFFLTPFCVLMWFLVTKSDTHKKYYWIFILLTLIGIYIDYHIFLH